MFIFEREKQNLSEGGTGREGGTESEAYYKLWAVSTEPSVGLEPMSSEIMTWAKVRRSTNWATQAPWEQDFLFTARSPVPHTVHTPIWWMQ